ncbi:LppM family (lipo)protein [Williamsia limnetica]|uniref:LppM family (lipo)protein n=1 Tax=Williamsia limnetica TaxID=882452 RepID=UPI0011B4CA80|nr:DUF3153 domain-containing protein [Williamsia limnetica]
MPQITPHPRGRQRRGPVSLVLLLLVLVCGPALAACSNSPTEFGDRLWGAMVLAEKDVGQDKGPQIIVPQSLEAVVSATEFKRDGLIGTRATFTEATLGQFTQLGELVDDAYPDTSVTMDLSAQRRGEVVAFRGTADLQGLAPGRDYVEFSVQFAGPVSATNGQQDGEDAVSWKPEIGKASPMTAEANYEEPGTAAFTGWTGLMAGIALAVTVIVVALAWVNRDQSPRPGAPSRRPADAQRRVGASDDDRSTL